MKAHKTAPVARTIPSRSGNVKTSMRITALQNAVDSARSWGGDIDPEVAVKRAVAYLRFLETGK